MLLRLAERFMIAVIYMKYCWHFLFTVGTAVSRNLKEQYGILGMHFYLRTKALMGRLIPLSGQGNKNTSTRASSHSAWHNFKLKMVKRAENSLPGFCCKTN